MVILHDIIRARFEIRYSYLSAPPTEACAGTQFSWACLSCSYQRVMTQPRYLHISSINGFLWNYSSLWKTSITESNDRPKRKRPTRARRSERLKITLSHHMGLQGTILKDQEPCSTRVMACSSWKEPSCERGSALTHHDMWKGTLISRIVACSCTQWTGRKNRNAF